MINYNVIFLNEEKKRVLFVPNLIEGIKKYFDKNEDATLVINFTKLLAFKNFNNFNILRKIKINKLLMIGSIRHDFNFDKLLRIEHLIELDNRNIDLAYDFLNFPNLEVLRYTWNEKCNNISECNKLKELSLWEYKPKSFDLKEFSDMKSVEEIRFVQSSITSIMGLGKHVNLKELSLVNNKNLSLKDIEDTFYNIETLYIENCNKIDDGFVKIFPNLKKLDFINNTPIESLKKILNELPNLEYLNIAGTKILESDNRYWKDYKKLKYFNFSDRNHQLLKLKDFSKENQ